jgi:hypothetical protein
MTIAPATLMGSLVRLEPLGTAYADEVFEASRAPDVWTHLPITLPHVCADLGDLIWAAGYPDPQDFVSMQWATDAPFNESAVGVPSADALMKQADVSSDTTGRLAQYQQAEQLLVDQDAFIATE